MFIHQLITTKQTFYPDLSTHTFTLRIPSDSWLDHEVELLEGSCQGDDLYVGETCHFYSIHLKDKQCILDIPRADINSYGIQVL